MSPVNELVIGPGPSRPEEGFTLIELLVVMIIIGILSAVSVPIFLSQRAKGYDTTAKSDLRQLAHNEEAYLIGKSTYASVDALEASGLPVVVSHDVTVYVVRFDGATGFCLKAKHSSSSSTWYYDSQAGGIQPTGSPGCPRTVAGEDGGQKPGP